jgi:hypothetical protein
MNDPKPDPAPGVRFSHVYGERGEPAEDSERMRHRIGATVSASDLLDRQLKSVIEKEIGISAPYSKNWTTFLKEMKLKDVLDLVTVTAHLLRRQVGDGEGMARVWLAAVDRIFREENVHYRTEPKGGVRFYIDEAFARTRASAVAAISGARHANALAEFEKGMAALAQAPPDGKGAIRGVFASAEGIFRLITAAPRLGAAELAALAPIFQRLYPQQDTALRSSQKMLASFKDWVDAAHFYRHEEGSEEPAQPPLQLAIYIVSSGTAHLRWLAELDTQIQA